jgi:hypothetical protein
MGRGANLAADLQLIMVHDCMLHEIARFAGKRVMACGRRQRQT